MSYEGMKKGIDLIGNDSADDHGASKPRVSLGDQIRSESAPNQFSRRAEKVWAVPINKKEEEEEGSQKLVPESRSEPEERVGDIIRLGKNSYFILDIFEKEIMELGDKVDLNFKIFKKFEVQVAEYGDAPRDHEFYHDRCCYYSRCCVCTCSDAIEKEWEILNRELDSGFWKGVSFFVRTYKERKELMRVVATENKSHSLFFFDIKFPKEYPKRAPSLFYHPYGLPLSTPEASNPMKRKEIYNVLDVFLYIQELVLLNRNKSCQQMLDMLRHPLTGFEYFVRGHFRKYAPFILRSLMEELDMVKERGRRMFWKMYVAFEDNKANCEYLLNSDLKEELKRFKEKEEEECSFNDNNYYSASSTYFPTFTSNRFDGMKRTSKSQFLWKALTSLLE